MDTHQLVDVARRHALNKLSESPMDEQGTFLVHMTSVRGQAAVELTATIDQDVRRIEHICPRDVNDFLYGLSQGSSQRGESFEARAQ